jgi:hypothetical protein
MNAAHPRASAFGPASGYYSSRLPELHRSEAFVEDLLDSGFAPTQAAPRQRPGLAPRWATVLLCAVPLLVALLGGALAFFHAVG